MTEPKRYDSCADGLEALLASGETGCLVSEAHPEGPRVYTMLGRLMAVVSNSDDEEIVSRWTRHCRPGAARTLEVQRAIRRGENVFDLLAAEVSGETLRFLGREQMSHNLSGFLGLSGPVWFEPMSQIFVPNTHADVDSYRMLEEARNQKIASKDGRAPPIPPAPVPSPVPSSQLPPPVSSRPPPVSSRPPPISSPSTLAPPVRKKRLDEEAYDAFADNDRHRSGGDGEFIVERRHLDVVDLDSGEAVSERPRSLRYAPQAISSSDVEAKIAAANEVLTTVFDVLHSSAGVRALPLLQQVAAEENAEFFLRLGRVSLDIRGRISMGSLQESLSLRPASEHRRSLEIGLVDLVDRTLDLCADHLTETEMDRLLESVMGVHQRLTS